MKITITEEKPVRPPKTITLVLSEDEAGLIRHFASYYGASDPTFAAAYRLREQIPQEFWFNAKYPYTDAFRVADATSKS